MSAQIRIKSDPKDELKSLLRSCLLFQEAGDDVLEFAVQHSETTIFNKGDCIILENEANNFVYFVAQGAVEIVSYLAHENRIQRLALLKEGSQFAEFSVLTDSIRSGSAYAFEDCVLVRMNGEGFKTMVKTFAPVSMKLINFLKDVNVKSEASGDVVPFYHPEQLSISADVLNYVPLATCQKMGVLPSSFQNNLLTLIMKNPQDHEFLSTLKRTFPKAEIAVYLISEKEFEPAFEILQKNALAPVVPHARAVGSEEAPLNLLSALKSSALLGAVHEDILQQIITQLQPLSVEGGSAVLQPGSQVEFYYLIARGKIQMQKPLAHGQAVSEIMTLNAGEGFGELQMLTGEAFKVFARASEASVVLPIPKSIFQQLLKRANFAFAMSKVLAQKLQVLGHINGLRYYPANAKLDFKELTNLLPISLIESQKALPLQLHDSELTLGLVHPDSSEILNAVSRYILDFRLKIFGLTDEQFKNGLTKLKSQADSRSALTLVAHAQQPKIEVIKWVDDILLTGLKNRSSDIHLEPSEEYLTVRFRIDGVLQEHPEKISGEVGKEVISRLKILSELDIGNQHIAQDGQLKTVVGVTPVLARASCMPVRYGEKLVLRLIRAKGSVVPMDMLVPERRVVNLLRKVTRCRQGLFLVTGPTGSGKTTTLYSMLNAINDVGVNVTTIEDPVEMELTGFNQIEVDRKRGLDFGNALRSVLRQDPNVIMVGEIRDGESAKIAFDASITGHLVFSTIHTNSSLDIVPRLNELGVTTATLAAGLLGVLSQRLVRANCSKCRMARPMLDSERSFIQQYLPNTLLPLQLHSSAGCPACNFSGYHHRIPVFELWRNTPSMRRALLEKKTPEEMMAVAREDGYETLQEAGLRMALSGLTSLEEVRRVLAAI